MKLSKQILCIFLAAWLLCSTLPLPASAAGGSLKSGVGFVTASALRLRAKATTASSTLAYASKDEVVVVLEQTGSWYKVLYNLQEGFMHASYLVVAGIENAELGYGKVNDTPVNMRSGPGTGYKAIGQSSQGDLAYVIGLNKQWYKVIWNDTICYIRSDYLDLIESPYENADNPKSPLFFEGGWSTGIAVAAETLKNSVNYIPPKTSTADAVIATAKKYIGIPYLWGGTSPAGFDCSGFTQYVFKQNGISLSRTCETQYQQGSYVSKANLQPGDLVFFQNTYKNGISHVGIYIGDGNFIHSSSSKGITITALSSSYWAPKYYGARRLL